MFTDSVCFPVSFQCMLVHISLAMVSSLCLIGYRTTLSLAQLAELFMKARQMLSLCVCVCLGVNQLETNRNRCTQRLVVLHAQTYTLMNPDRIPKTKSV